jgi:hypothetical protein
MLFGNLVDRPVVVKCDNVEMSSDAGLPPICELDRAWSLTDRIPCSPLLSLCRGLCCFPGFRECIAQRRKVSSFQVGLSWPADRSLHVLF